MRRRTWVVLAALLLVAAGLGLLRSRAGAPGGGAGAPAAVGPRDPQAYVDAVRGRLGGAAPLVPVGQGSLELRGKVIGPDGPVAGAAVTATLAQKEDSLSELPCACGNACGRKLLACGCAEAASQMMELVMERRGEAPPVAGTTTDANGDYVLTGLEARSYALWAQKAELIGVNRAAVGGATSTEVRVAPGAFVSGKVVDEDKHPLPGAVVTAIYIEHSRFFEALSAADGSFQVGPLPPGKYALVGIAPALLPDSRSLTELGDSAVTLTLYRPRTLQGQVLRGEQPVAGAEVSMQGEHKKEQLRSDRDGRFAFERLRPGDYALLATEGAESASTTVHLERPPGGTVSLQLGPGAGLSGVVRTADGATIGGARVSATVEVRGEDPVLQTTAEADGRYRFAAVPAGKVEVSARAAGFSSGKRVERVLRVGQRAEVDLSLERSVAITGRVVDETGAPIAGALLSATGAKSRAGSDQRSSPEGAFTLGELAAGHYTIRASHEQFEQAEQEVDAPGTVTLMLRTGLRLRGVVVDAEGTPVAKARVVASGVEQDPGAGRTQEASAQTGLDGRFLLGGLAPGKIRVRAMVDEAADGPSRDFQFTPSRELTLPTDEVLRLQLVRGLTLSGTTVDPAGTPVPGARVTAYQHDDSDDGDEESEPGSTYAQAVSGADGHFTLRHLRSGEFRLDASTDQLTTREGKHTVQALAGATGVRLVLHPSARVRGHVYGPGRRVLDAFWVNGERFDDSTGAFELPLPSGRAEALPLLFEGGPELSATSRTITPSGGQDVQLEDVVLSGGITVSGQVMDAETGTPVEGALVDIADPPDRAKPAEPEEHPLSVDRGAVRTGADGRFVLAHVEAAPPQLVATHEDYLPLRMPLDPSAEVVVRMSRGGVLDGTVTLASGKPFSGMVWAGDHRAFLAASDQGHFRFTRMLPGPYQVQARSFGGGSAIAPARVTLSGHETVQVTLAERADGSTVTVTIAGPGTPYALLLTGTVPQPKTLAEVQALVDQGAFQPAPVNRTTQQFKSVPPGAYTVLYGRQEGATIRVQTMAVTVQEGQPLNLEAVLDGRSVAIPAEDWE